tara:strand:- start:747 stop:938 length:192 start_codon:yes stop_codon:yes gene_type:complete
MLNKEKPKILNSKMVIQWSDKEGEEEILWEEFPKDLATYLDAFLGEIEDKRNTLKEINNEQIG